MPIDRDSFLRAALLLSLGGSPVLAAGCTLTTDDGTTAQPAEVSGGGESSVVEAAAPAEESTPVDESAPVDESGGAAVYE
jgi:hypothetical protein